MFRNQQNESAEGGLNEAFDAKELQTLFLSHRLC